MRLWCFEDAHDWGLKLAQAAQARGHDVHLFDDPRKPDFGFVFMHMHHHPSVRLLHKRVMAIMAMNPELTLVPDYRSSMLYDDKLEQARQLARWMPRTHVYYTPGAARRALENGIVYPFVSKGSEGASSHNVRIVSSPDEARLEIKQAFSDIGIKCRHGQTQRGYLLWQDFIAGNEYDVRVVAIGSKRMVLRRANRTDKPMSSGSGVVTPVVKLDVELYAALDTANKFFEAENLKWAGVDLIRDAGGRWFVLETTVGWTMHGYYECRFFDNQSNALDVNGDKVWDVFLGELENGAFK